MDYFEVQGVGMFLERSDPNPRKAVHLLWAGEKVRSHYPLPSPNVDEREMLDRLPGFRRRLEWTLKLRIGTADGLDGIATWRTITSRRFDADAFGRDHPDLRDAYLRDSRTRRFDLL